MEIPFELTNNYIKGRKSVEFIIIHAMDGYFEGSKAWFKNSKSQVSAHYLISQKGEVVQMVKDSNTAWHCFGLNNRSIGVELEDKKQSRTNPNWATDAMLNSAVKLIAKLMEEYSVPIENVLGHDTPWIQKINPAMAHNDPGKNFPWTKFRTLITKELEELNK